MSIDKVEIVFDAERFCREVEPLIQDAAASGLIEDEIGLAAFVRPLIGDYVQVIAAPCD